MKRTIIVFIFLLIPCLSWGATYLSDSFESGNLTSSEGIGSWTGFEYRSGDAGALSTDMAHTGTYSAKFTFTGNASLEDDAQSQLVFNFGQNIQEFWLQYYVFFPSNYDIRATGGSDNTKLFVIWGDSYSTDPLAMGMEMENDERAGFKAYVAGYPAALSCAGLFGYVPGGLRWTLESGDKNKWIKFKFHVKRDSGAGDGMFEMWVDDVKEIELLNQSFAGAPCSPNYWRHGYLMGWSNSGFTETTNVYIDDVVIADADPGDETPTPTGSLRPGVSASGVTFR